MSEPVRILLVGATGLVGQQVMEQAISVPQLRVVALGRRETRLPRGGRIEMLVADTADWPAAIARIAPDAVICALGTTWKQSGRSEDAFRAVDHDLVLAVAGAARQAGVRDFVVVSAVGADPFAKNFYLRVKGETDAALGKLRFSRLDILRPGLLRGERGGDRRLLERIGILASPLTDLFLGGERSRFRSIEGADVARAALSCVLEKASGRFVHENTALLRLSARLERPA